jgi:hypothetical protein
MKRIILILCVIIFCSNCNSKKSNIKAYEINNAKQKRDINLKLQVEINYKLKKNISEVKNNISLFHITVNFTNQDDSTIRFWAINHVWQDNFITNSNIISLPVFSINHYFPDTFSIKSGKKITFDGILEVDLGNQKKGEELKIGFIFIKVNEYNCDNDFCSDSINNYKHYDSLIKNKIRMKKDIIWSNSFKIPE